MEFDYDFTKCPICGSKMHDTGMGVLKCKNGCCRYDFDNYTSGMLVYAVVFNDKHYLIDRYEDNYKNDSERNIMKNNLTRFLLEVRKWKRNDRYLMKILTEVK